jgi:hypothetical protein
MMEKMGLKSGEVIDSPMVTRGIARAQRKVEARNFDIRKHLLEYDEVMDKQRKFIYGQRQEALQREGLREKSLGMFEAVLDPVVERCAGDKDKPVDWEELRKWLLHRTDSALDLTGLEQVDREQIFDWVTERVEKLFAARQEAYGEDDWNSVQRFLLIDTIDNKWKDHLHAMEVLKAGVGLRSYAQIDPKNEYKKEGYEKFQQLKIEIAEQVTSFLFKQEATDTIREMIAGRLQPQPVPRPAPQPVAMPQSPQELMQIFEQLVAGGQVPADIVEKVRSGELEVVATPQGISVRPAQAGAAAPAGAGAPAPQPQRARTPAELQEVFEQLVRERKIPPEIEAQIRQGLLELIETPQGLTVRPTAKAQAQAQAPRPRTQAELKDAFEQLVREEKIPAAVVERIRKGELDFVETPQGMTVLPSAVAAVAPVLGDRWRTPQELQALAAELTQSGALKPHEADAIRQGKAVLAETSKGVTVQASAQAQAEAQAQQAPRSREEAQAVFDSLVAAGQVPPEIVARVQQGELEVWHSPNGIELRPKQAPSAATSPAPAGPAKPVAAAIGAPRAAGVQRPANAPKPGRNDNCPCGSGIKYKKCCAPAFD